MCLLLSSYFTIIEVIIILVVVLVVISVTSELTCLSLCGLSDELDVELVTQILVLHALDDESLYNHDQVHVFQYSWNVQWNTDNNDNSDDDGIVYLSSA